MRYREQRYPADTALRIEFGERVERAHLVNVSATGARLSQLAPLPSGTVLNLCYLSIRLSASVIWSNQRQTGIRFTRPISMGDVNVLRGAGGRPAGAWGTSNHWELRELG